MEMESVLSLSPALPRSDCSSLYACNMLQSLDMLDRCGCLDESGFFGTFNDRDGFSLSPASYARFWRLVVNVSKYKKGGDLDGTIKHT